jgi:hypothetical protein
MLSTAVSISGVLSSKGTRFGQQSVPSKYGARQLRREHLDGACHSDSLDSDCELTFLNGTFAARQDSLQPRLGSA